AAVILAAIAKAHPERVTTARVAAPKVAAAKKLPAFLDPPPWLAPKKAKVAIETIDLEPMTVPLRKDEREGDLEPLADYARWGGEVVDHHRKQKKKTREDWLEEVA